MTSVRFAAGRPACADSVRCSRSLHDRSAALGRHWLELFFEHELEPHSVDEDILAAIRADAQRLAVAN